MVYEHVILQIAPFTQLLLANSAQIAMLIFSVIFHVQESIAFEVTNFALKFDNSGVNSFMCGDLYFILTINKFIYRIFMYRCLADKQFFTEMALVGFSEDMGHFLMFSKLPRSQKFLST
jgi:hypothetical protein